MMDDVFYIVQDGKVSAWSERAAYGTRRSHYRGVGGLNRPCKTLIDPLCSG